MKLIDIGVVWYFFSSYFVIKRYLSCKVPNIYIAFLSMITYVRVAGKTNLIRCSISFSIKAIFKRQFGFVCLLFSFEK